MTTSDFAGQKAIIRAELEKRARVGETICYSALAKLVGLANQGLRPILEAIMDEEAEQGRPDLGCLAVLKITGFPSYVGIGDGERRRAEAQRRAVFRAWPNPS